ncbi:MAG: tyrosine-type recombinase/integrase [Clostridia bacterium]|nr:tyrosine-type recombinase/integrase [Clostridia bacterium]
MRTQWVPQGEIVHVLAALQPKNRLACEISLATGLRINDVLALKTEQIKQQRFTVREEKTGKTRAIYIPKELHDRAITCSGKHFVFEGRCNGKVHRSRQAVFKDLKRVAKLFGIKENVAPHSLRKIFAVEEYAKHGNLKRVQKLLNHSSEAVTQLYAFANVIDKRKNFR